MWKQATQKGGAARHCFFFLQFAKKLRGGVYKKLDALSTARHGKRSILPDIIIIMTVIEMDVFSFFFLGLGSLHPLRVTG